MPKTGLKTADFAGAISTKRRRIKGNLGLLCFFWITRRNTVGPEDGLEETGQPLVGFCFLAANQSVAQ